MKHQSTILMSCLCLLFFCVPPTPAEEGRIPIFERTVLDAFHDIMEGLTGRVIMTDINAEMLVRGRDRLLNAGHRVAAMVCDAEALPFADDQFDRVTLAFGLRNMTHKEQALAQILRVLKPGGKLLVLEFSRVIKPLERAYDFYSFKILPWLGERITQDRHSYEYLAESIRMHPGPNELAEMMRGIGFGVVRHSSHTGGVVALHQAVKV